LTRKRKPTRRPRRAWIAITALGVLGVCGFALHARSGHPAQTWLSEKLRAPRFRLQAVEFLGLEKLAPMKLLERAGLGSRVPLIDLDPDVLIGKLSSHPRVASCVAARIPPRRLVVEIEERVPVARIAGTQDGVDIEGARFPLAASEAAALTSVRGDVRWALPLLRTAQELEVKLVAVDVRARDDLRFRPADREVEVRVGLDPAMSLRGWLRIRDSGLLQSHAARRVDLRFQGSALLRDFRKTKKSKGGGQDGSS
jgi:hypothetical protein